MKRIVLSAVLCACPLYAQTVPQLSTADKIALQTTEKQKQEAGKQYAEAQQAQGTILQEFAAAHPGFHFDLQTGVVVKNAPTPNPAPAPKKEGK